MKETILKCDECGRQFIDCSPPTNKAYKSGFIRIDEHSTMLLPRQTKKEGNSVSLEGHYCNAYCLINNLKKLIERYKIKAQLKN